MTVASALPAGRSMENAAADGPAGEEVGDPEGVTRDACVTG